jgi:antitoxin ParD1/3/4/toxin ParE1/3/4
MTVGYQLSNIAATDLMEIWLYLADTASIEVADHVIADIREALTRVAEVPGIGHFREDLLPDQHKVYLVHKYSIVYLHEFRPILIERILHSSRDMRRMLF